MYRYAKRIEKLPQREQLALFHKRVHKWIAGVWKREGIQVHIVGLQNIPQNTTVVFVSNHVSFLEIQARQTHLPTPVMTLAKAESAKVPIFGKVWSCSSVLVDRHDADSRKAALEKMQKWLDYVSILFYPEGTRNRTMEVLLPFEPGAFITSCKTGKPIVPAVVIGAEKILPPGCAFNPGECTIKILPPIYPQGKTIKQLRDEVRGIMLTELQ
ncbi:MAG: lysophospholipid acyltransferase family protein [bacterium]